MNHRNRRGSTRAKAAVAAAVLVGGGAAAVIGVAANHDGGGGGSLAAQNAAFARSFHQTINEPNAVMGALNGWRKSHNNAMTMLAEMKPMRTFSEFNAHHASFAAQRGVVVYASPQFLLVKSANGSLHIWWLTGKTAVVNVSSSATGLVAMTGSPSAAAQSMMTGSMNSAANVMAGGMSALMQMKAPQTTKTYTVNSGGSVFTIKTSHWTSTVTEPGTMSPSPSTSPSGMPSTSPSMSASPSPSMSASATPTMTATQPVTTTVNGVAAGDMVLVVGQREHGKLVAELVLFVPTTTTGTATPSAPASMSATPTATSSATMTPTATTSATPTMAPTPTGTSNTLHFSGKGS